MLKELSYWCAEHPTAALQPRAQRHALHRQRRRRRRSRPAAGRRGRRVHRWAALAAFQLHLLGNRREHLPQTIPSAHCEGEMPGLCSGCNWTCPPRSVGFLVTDESWFYAVQMQGVGTPVAAATPATPEHSTRSGIFGRVGRHRRNSSSQASLVSLASIGRNESFGGPETPLRRESRLCII